MVIQKELILGDHEFLLNDVYEKTYSKLIFYTPNLNFKCTV